MHQGPVKMKLPGGNAHTQFPKSAKQIFFHLTGHAGLLRSFATGSVRIRVGWERTVQFGRLMGPDAGIDFEVVIEQAAQ